MLDNVVPLFPGIPGGPEVLIVLFVLVLLFGANKIPKLARSTGEAMGEFKKGRQEIEEELKETGSSETAQGGTTASTPSESTGGGASSDADASTEVEPTSGGASSDADASTEVESTSEEEPEPEREAN